MIPTAIPTGQLTPDRGRRRQWLAAYPVIAFEDLSLEALMPELLQTGQV